MMIRTVFVQDALDEPPRLTPRRRRRPRYSPSWSTTWCRPLIQMYRDSAAPRKYTADNATRVTALINTVAIPSNACSSSSSSNA
jgi:hypothetical protein